MNPKVTFVVPCYKLAHLLPDCINSILSQTYDDFELLIMDDQSPDNTPEVAASFADPRIKHIRNETNLGHLRNYNKGIELATGEYIWLVSADDRLRTPRALEHYVQVLDANPRVGFACCPAIELRNGSEIGLAKYSVVADKDTVFRGHDFLKILLDSDVVIASSGIVRRTCYEKLGAFPLDLPYAGDWYMWCLFALYYDVAYIAEPMVNYRGHELSMTQILMTKSIRILVADNLTVLWRIKQRAEQAGYTQQAARCSKGLAYEYARYIMGEKYPQYTMSWDELDESLRQYAHTEQEARHVRARVCIAVGDRHFEHRNFNRVKDFYNRGLREDPSMSEGWVKRILLQLGSLGVTLRNRRVSRRRMRGDALVGAVELDRVTR